MFFVDSNWFPVVSNELMLISIDLNSVGFRLASVVFCVGFGWVWVSFCCLFLTSIDLCRFSVMFSSFRLAPGPPRISFGPYDPFKASCEDFIGISSWIPLGSMGAYLIGKFQVWQEVWQSIPKADLAKIPRIF